MIAVELGPSALLVLAAISALAGVGAMFAFLRWTDRDAFGRCSDQIIALVMEQALFIDDPVLVLRAQRELLRQNGRLLILLARPTVIAATVFLLALPHLEALFGRAALRTGDPAVITVQRIGPASAADFSLKPPPGIAVETPGVDIPVENQISWRIRPLRSVSTKIEIVGPDGGSYAKRIAAGPGIHYISPRRPGSWIKFLLDPVEKPLAGSQAAYIAIDYPPACILHLNWMIWFLGVSTIAATAAYFLRRS